MDVVVNSFTVWYSQTGYGGTSGKGCIGSGEHKRGWRWDGFNHLLWGVKSFLAWFTVVGLAWMGPLFCLPWSSCVVAHCGSLAIPMCMFVEEFGGQMSQLWK